MKKGRRHLTPQEIIAQCNGVAREIRMKDRTPWTAMGIICGYTLLKSEGFKGQRIFNVTQKIDEYENLYHEGKLDLEEERQWLKSVTGWELEWRNYTEEDIVWKKGTYLHWIDEKQLQPQNDINTMALRYMIFFFKALNELYGYGEGRLNRVELAMRNFLNAYLEDKTSVLTWRKTLFAEAGVVFENPIDPKYGAPTASIMTGGGI